MTLPGYYTMQEAADAIGVSKPQVSKYLATGRLKGIRVGNQVLFSRRQVDKFERPDLGRPKSLSR